MESVWWVQKSSRARPGGLCLECALVNLVPRAFSLARKRHPQVREKALRMRWCTGGSCWEWRISLLLYGHPSTLVMCRRSLIFFKILINVFSFAQQSTVLHKMNQSRSPSDRSVSAFALSNSSTCVWQVPYNLWTCLFLCYFTILPCHSVVSRYLIYFLFVFHRTLVRCASWRDCLAWKSPNGCWIHSLQWKTTVQLLWITESATLPKCASSYLKAATFTVCTSTLWTERPPSRKF